MARKSILVTDGEQRAALAAVRSLGRAGHQMTVCASRRGSMAGASRYASREVVVPSALDVPARYADAVIDAAASAQADLVLPVSEPSCLALLPVRERVRGIVPMTSAESFRAVSDKSAVLSAATRHGIAIPRQVVLASAEEAAQHDWTGCFPLAIKPTRSVVGLNRSRTGDADAGARAKTAVSYAESAAALHRQLSELHTSVYPVLVQERIAGPGFAISLLIWDGQLRAAFAHRRLREKPPSGGVSVLREAIPLDDGLLAQSIALLHEFTWQGVAMVEFKTQQATGVPYLMEINGRLWGSLQLAVDAGVDFPDLLVQCAFGATPAPRTTYATGTRTRWEWGDVDHLLARVRRSREALALPSDAPSRLRAVFDFILSTRAGIHNEVLHLDDPMPFVRESWDWFRQR